MSAWSVNFYGTRTNRPSVAIRVGVHPRYRAGCHFGSGDILGHKLGGADTMNFWVIETESLDGTMKEVRGPFDTRAAAEAHIRRDFEVCWNQSEISLDDRDEDWSGTWLIVEQVAEVKPVAKTTLKTVLVEVK
jgi:hypothetical protein